MKSKNLPAKKSPRKLAGPLLRAAIAGDLKRVRELLATGADPEQRVCGKPTVLMEAARCGQVEVVKALLEGGAKIDFKHGGKTGVTALQFAIQHHQFEAAGVLVAAGADMRYAPSGKSSNLVDRAIQECNEIFDATSLRSLKRTAIRKQNAGQLLPSALALVKQMLVTGGKPAGSCLPNVAAHGNLPLVRLLLSCGIKVNEQQQDSSRRDTATAFSQAVHYGHVDLAIELVRADADPNLGRTIFGAPFHLAVVRGMMPLIKAIIAAKADLNHRADVQLDDPAKSELPAQPAAAYFRLNVDHLEYEHAYLSTPLIVAVRCQNVAILKLLIDGGAKLEVVDADGLTALAWALKLGRKDLAKILQRAGAKNGNLDGSAFNRLFLACAKGDLESARAAITAGADVNAAKESPAAHTTSLMLAARYGHLPVVDVLLQAGADPNFAGREEVLMIGITPLMLAARYGHVEVVKRLLAVGADAAINLRSGINIRDKGDTALHEAARNGHARIVETFLQAGLTPDARSAWASSVLDSAVGSGDLETVKVLIAAGADPNPKLRNQLTPLQTANGYGHRHVARFLRKLIAVSGEGKRN